VFARNDSEGACCTSISALERQIAGRSPGCEASLVGEEEASSEVTATEWLVTNVQACGSMTAKLGEDVSSVSTWQGELDVELLTGQDRHEGRVHRREVQP